MKRDDTPADILIVGHDSTSNALGRAAILADVLSPLGKVAIVAFGERVWTPMKSDVRVRLLPPPHTNADLVGAVRSLKLEASRAQMMVAVKTRVLSFGVASLARGSTPLALDIDDLEREFVRRRFGLLRQIVSPDHWPATHFLERWRPPLLVTTVASRKLQEKYGGEWLPHVRDRRGIREDRLLARALARRQLGLDESAFVVGFLGTVRRHKGIATLVEALKRVNGARLVIVGHAADTNNDVFTDVQGSPAIVLPGPQLSRLGAAMASFDIVAIPQSRTLAAEYQSPAKLLDAMAAGLPVVAGNTGDALEILGDTGLVVMPDSPAALADAISQLKNRQIRSDLARRTYARFLDCFDLPRWQTRIGARFEQSLAH